jgi:hypothetical protein
MEMNEYKIKLQAIRMDLWVRVFMIDVQKHGNGYAAREADEALARFDANFGEAKTLTQK